MVFCIYYKENLWKKIFKKVVWSDAWIFEYVANVDVCLGTPGVLGKATD